MTGEAWVFLTGLTVVSLLLTVAIGGNSHLAAENRALRRENARLRQHRAAAMRQVVGRDGGAA